MNKNKNKYIVNVNQNYNDNALQVTTAYTTNEINDRKFMQYFKAFNQR
jgi:hypothetical protein